LLARKIVTSILLSFSSVQVTEIIAEDYIEAMPNRGRPARLEVGELLVDSFGVLQSEIGTNL
jgi:hypothetical protein